MAGNRKTVVIVASVVVSALVLFCALPSLALVWFAYNTPNPEPSQQLGAMPAASSPAAEAPAAATATSPPQTAPAPAPTTTTAAASPLDRAEFDAYWASGSVPPSVASLTKSVAWEADSLTAHTRIVFDADAKDAATKVCSALSGYWLTAGKPFRPVRVLDSADQILVSRRSLGEACEWRR